MKNRGQLTCNHSDSFTITFDDGTKKIIDFNEINSDCLFKKLFSLESLKKLGVKLTFYVELVKNPDGLYKIIYIGDPKKGVDKLAVKTSDFFKSLIDYSE